MFVQFKEEHRPICSIEVLKAEYVDNPDLSDALHISLRKLQDLRDKRTLPHHQLEVKNW
jgi:hypothetical protein